MRLGGDWDMLAPREALERPRPEPGSTVVLEVTIAAVSLANAREAWGARKRRAEMQRQAVRLAWRRAGHWEARYEPVPGRRKPVAVEPILPLRVVLVRVAPRELDSDNLQTSLKHVRDELAAILGFDDRCKAVEWVYRQERGVAAVRIEVHV